MKKRKVFALLCVALTLLSVGVSVYALQPPQKNPVSDYLGFWQNQRQDGNDQYAWNEYVCACGVTLYSLDIDHPVLMGDIVNTCTTAGTGQLAYADCGLVANYTVDDPHDANSHVYGQFLLSESYNDIIYTSLSKPLTSASIIILLETNNAELMLRDREFFLTNIVGSAANTVRTYALVNVFTSIYDEYIYNRGLSIGYGTARDEYYPLGYQDGYADGQINATENVTIIGTVDEIISGVASAFNPILEFEVLGVSALSLVGLMCTLFVVLLIIKVVRS